MQPTYRHWLWILALIGLAADQASKYGVFHALQTTPQNRTEVIPGAFDLVAQWVTPDEPHVNTGALFGMGRGANVVFATISLLAAIAIIWWGSYQSTAHDRGLCLALGLILGGTLGNLYDRVIFGGVRDFLHWKYLVNWPVFNFADCCLVCGAGLLLIQAFRSHPAPEPEPAAISVPAAEPSYAGAAVVNRES